MKAHLRRLFGLGVRTRALWMLVLTAAVAIGVGLGSASANNDPHRIFVPAEPFDVPEAVCGFPIHVDIVANKEYAKVTEAPDGSTTLKITGVLKVALTNTATGKTIQVNASGPGTGTFPANSPLGIYDLRGLNLFFVTNGAEFGLPNFALTSGLFRFTIDFETLTYVSVERRPHVLLDACAALA